MAQSYVVTGGGRGIGRAIVERLLGARNTVVVLERDVTALDWAGERVLVVEGDASADKSTERAADLAEQAGELVGWVNNAAVFRDATVDSMPSAQIVDLITSNLAPAVTGSSTAVRRFLRAERPGAIVNVTSHQAQRAVPGALPYSTAKAAIEGLTRALAVEYGRRGVRVNAVAPGSVDTERYAQFLAGLTPAAADRVTREMATLHPIGRVARTEEIAAAVAFLLSPEASFINGAVLPVDGGRSVLALDPETE